MGRSCSLFSVAVVILVLFVSSGYGRKQMSSLTGSSITRKEIDMPEKVEVSLHGAAYHQRRREMSAMVEDYADPGANTNPGNGAWMASPPPAARH